jgi:PAS domain S-box-containing protein
VQYWKNRLFAASAVYLIPLSMIAVVPGIYVALKQGLVGMLAADFITIGTILGVILIPGLSVFVRKLLFNAALYFISVVMLHYLGSNGPGMLYLLAVTIFVVLSLDKFYGFVVLALNILTCLFFAVVIHYEFANTILLTEYQLDTWIGVSSNLIFLSGTAVFLIPHLFKGLQSSFDEQNILKDKLEQSIDELKLSEQKFKALVQDGSDLIAILDEEANYKYVAPTADSVLGITAEEFIGTNALDYIHENDQERIASIISNLGNGEQVEVAPFRFRDSNKDWRWIETIITNMLENPAVKGFVANSRDVTDHIERERKLRTSLKEKETLLAEIHHRVKNNLAVVSGMIQLQAFGEEDDKLRAKLYDSVSRIQTMGAIHELLYQSKSFAELDFDKMIRKLISEITSTFNSDVSLDKLFNLQSMHLNINQAIPCSLIVNEVVTNVLKHAFDERNKGILNTELSERNGTVILKIEDNGKGLPENFGQLQSGETLGLKLIDTLSEQLDAEYNYYPTENGGTKFTLHFEKADVRGIGNANLK